MPCGGQFTFMPWGLVGSGKPSGPAVRTGLTKGLHTALFPHLSIVTSPKWYPTLGHLIFEIQPFKVAVEHEAMDITIQGEICISAIPVHPHIVPA